MTIFECMKANPPIEGDWLTQYCKRIAEKLDVTVRACQMLYRRRGGELNYTFSPAPNAKGSSISIPVEELDILPVEQVRHHRMKGEIAALKKRNKGLLEELHFSEARFDQLAAIKEKSTEHKIRVPKKSTLNNGVACLLWSDWHIEENVDPKTINYPNEYNPEIASERSQKVAQNSLEIIRAQRSGIKLDTLFIWLGGDFITGFIHEELREENHMSPTIATRYVKGLIIDNINFFLNHGDFDQIVITCNYGNHGRTTKKPRAGTGWKNSYEFMMYADIADHFKGEKKVTIHVPESYIAYTSFNDFRIRTWHGCNVRYVGGVGGVTIPLRKAIMGMNDQKKADYNFLGHYHQFHEPTKDCLMNGSLIGFGPYAEKIKCSPEPPQQGFCILHLERNQIVGKFPVWCN